MSPVCPMAGAPKNSSAPLLGAKASNVVMKGASAEAEGSAEAASDEGAALGASPRVHPFSSSFVVIVVVIAAVPALAQLTREDTLAHGRSTAASHAGGEVGDRETTKVRLKSGRSLRRLRCG